MTTFYVFVHALGGFALVYVLASISQAAGPKVCVSPCGVVRSPAQGYSHAIVGPHSCDRAVRTIDIFLGCHQIHLSQPRDGVGGLQQGACRYRLDYWYGIAWLMIIPPQYRNGVFRVPLTHQWLVVCCGRQALEDMRKAGDDVLSMEDALEEVRLTATIPKPSLIVHSVSRIFRPNSRSAERFT